MSYFGVDSLYLEGRGVLVLYKKSHGCVDISKGSGSPIQFLEGGSSSISLPGRVSQGLERVGNSPRKQHLGAETRER